VAKPQIKLDRAGIHAVLNSDGVRAALREKGQALHEAALAQNPTASGEPIPVEYFEDEITPRGSRSSGSRPRVGVALAHPAGIAVEAKRAPLLKALNSIREG